MISSALNACAGSIVVLAVIYSMYDVPENKCRSHTTRSDGNQKSVSLINVSEQNDVYVAKLHRHARGRQRRSFPFQVQIVFVLVSCYCLRANCLLRTQFIPFSPHNTSIISSTRTGIISSTKKEIRISFLG